MKNFPFYLRRSFYVHLVIVLVMILSGRVLFKLGEEARNRNLELVQASVRVDMVAMPTHTLSELKAISSGVEEAKKEEAQVEAVKEEVKEEIKEEAVAKEDNSTLQFEEAKEKKRQDFLSKLKKIANKKVDSNGNQKQEKGLYGDRSTDLKKLVLSGNKLSKGTQMYGDGGGAELTAFQVYASRLPDLVRPYWRLPSFLLDKKLKCRVRVWINNEGDVVRSEIYQSSGDSEYDQRALEAVRSASPFPSVSAEFLNRAKNGDILLGFPL